MRSLLSVMLVVCTLVVSVFPAVPGPVAPATPACRHLTILLYDVTGSFVRWLPQAVTHGQRTIQTLRPGDCLLVRTIGATSFRTESVLTIRVPTSSRPIDPAFERDVVALKRRGVRELATIIALRPAGATDVWGSLYAASQTLQASRATQRTLAVYSDLDDNVRVRATAMTLALTGVDVAVYFVPREPHPDRFVTRLRQWQVVFGAAGATTTRFYDTNLFPFEVQP
jgi:hypothetical protein